MPHLDPHNTTVTRPSSKDGLLSGASSLLMQLPLQVTNCSTSTTKNGLLMLLLTNALDHLLAPLLLPTHQEPMRLPLPPSAVGTYTSSTPMILLTPLPPLFSHSPSTSTTQLLLLHQPSSWPESQPCSSERFELAFKPFLFPYEDQQIL
jgi:hypothetical protein